MRLEPSRSVPVRTRPSAAETVGEVWCRRIASVAISVVIAAIKRTVPSAAVPCMSLSINFSFEKFRGQKSNLSLDSKFILTSKNYFNRQNLRNYFKLRFILVKFFATGTIYCVIFY